MRGWKGQAGKGGLAAAACRGWLVLAEGVSILLGRLGGEERHQYAGENEYDDADE